MEIWLIYALLSIVCAGLYTFSIKVASARNYNSSLIVSYGYMMSALFAGAYFIYEGSIVTNYNVIIILAIINAFSYFLSLLSRMESMKNIDSVIFFPLYKTFSPVFVTILSIYFFNEHLSVKESIGIIIGICVPLLLITTNENKIQKNLKRGVILIILTAFFVVASNGTSKEVMVRELNVSFFIFCTSFLGMIFSFISYKLFSKKSKKKYNKNGILLFGLIMGFLHYLTFLTFQRALTGNLAIVCTINSFSMLIPIILSIFFYKEHFSYKKGFVIILSIISILMFI